MCEVVLNPNCSEAVVRLKVDKLTEGERKELLNLMQEFEENSEDYGENTVSYKKIFGINVIEIDGAAPYHSGDEIDKRLEQSGFSNKVEVERDES